MTPSEFLKEVFSGCSGKIEIRAIYSDKRVKQRYFLDVKEAGRYIASFDGQANIYVGAGTRLQDSGTKEDVKEIPALWADCDTPESATQLATFPLVPTLTLETSPGRVHAWWLLKEPLLVEHEGTIATVEGVLRGIVAHLHSDPSVAEVARVMRVPGTINVKRGAPCKLLENTEVRYEISDFLAAGLFEEKAASANGHRGRVNTAAVLAGVADGKRDTDLFRLACKLRHADVPQEYAMRLVLEAAPKCIPPLPLGEAAEKVTNVYRRYPAGRTREEVESSPRELVKPIDLATLMTGKPEPIPWVIEPLLAKGEALIIAGESGIGKSWLTGDLALCLSAGLLFLSILPVADGPYRVMVVDAENSERLVRWRLRKLARGRNLSAEQVAALPVAYRCQKSIDLGDEADRSALFRAIEDYRPDWVIFDSLIRIHRGEENSNSEMRDIFAQLDRVREYNGAGYVVTHHLRKPAKGEAGDEVRYRIRGAGDVLAAVDEAWGLQRGGDGFTLIHEKTRWDTPSPNLSVTIEDVQDGTGVMLVAAESNRVVCNTVDRMLKDAGEAGAMRADLLDEAMKAGGGRKATADKSLTRELGRRYAQRLVKKKGSTRAGVRYWLAEFAPEDAV